MKGFDLKWMVLYSLNKYTFYLIVLIFENHITAKGKKINLCIFTIDWHPLSGQNVKLYLHKSM